MKIKGLHETKLYVNECTSRAVCRNFACKGETNLGHLKRVGGGVQLQVASGGALEDNVKKLVW